MLFIDLDNFKSLNDTRGHDVGDLLLVEAAARLKRCVRETDTVARLGGDEFVVMLENLSVEFAQAVGEAERVATPIIQAMQAPFELAVIGITARAALASACFWLPGKCGRTAQTRRYRHVSGQGGRAWRGALFLCQP